MTFNNNQCESHAVSDSSTTVTATTNSRNPDWSGLDLCEECAEHYDAEPPLPIDPGVCGECGDCH